jgi:AAA domain, putative AbiEii toxin, Type IV TA system
MTSALRISAITFHHFKAFERFHVPLDHTNVLTGTNNAGKSTVIGALRALAIALRSARARNPERLHIGAEWPYGYRISDKVMPISVENCQTNYQDGASYVTFRLSNGNRLLLHFDIEHGCMLVPEVPDKVVSTAALFKTHFPLELTVVPVLGALEHKETLLDEDTVNAALSTSRASRHFRNYWYRRRGEFREFADRIAASWPGMEVKAPELNLPNRELTMFVSEERMDRELYWVGFGFQIWCQLITHILRSTQSATIVVDEPETYLHPDLHRKLLDVLRSTGAAVVVATHSTEILADADPADIVLIDKKRAKAERLRDIEGVQRAIDILGSQQNITLTALARNRRVLFVEDDHDFSLIRRFAKRLGLVDLSAGIGLAPIPSGGFGSWKRISILADGIGEALGTELSIGVVYDRDYFCDEDIAGVLENLRDSVQLAHVHESKEIENYLLVPTALDRAIAKAVAERADKGHPIDSQPQPSKTLLNEITEELRDDAEVQYVDKYREFFKETRRDGRDGSTLTKAALQLFRERWNNPLRRLTLTPGKETLKRLRDRLAIDLGISLSDARIVEAMRADEVPSDLRALLFALDAFRAGTR